MSTNKKKASAFTLDRRQFIVASSAAMTGVAVSAFADSVAPLAAGSIPPLLSVGYWNGTDRSASQQVGADLRVVRASEINSDPSLIQSGARISVDGFWRRGRSGPIAVTLLANFRTSASTDSAKTPFVAWSYVDDSRVVKASNRVKFDVPVDAADGIEMSVARSAGSGRRRGVRAPVYAQPSDPAAALVRNPGDVESTFVLSVNGDSRAPKLAAGTYFIALRSDARQAEPSWSSMHVFAADNGSNAPWLRGDGILVPETPEFDYLVLTIAPVKPLDVKNEVEKPEAAAE